MTNLALAPVNLPGGLAILNVTTNLLSLSSYTGVTFPNDGRSFLLLVNGATAATATVKIGATVEGQAVASPAAFTIPANTTVALGQWNADFAAAGFGGTVEVDFGTPATLQCVLLHDVGTR
jgi:hypothetical protein